MKSIADRVSAPSSKGAFDIWEKALALEAKGQDVIHLEIGEPDFGTPIHIIEEAERAMRAGRTTYSLPSGTPSLRRTVAEYLSTSRQIEANPDQVLVGPGVKGVMYAAFGAMVNPGDEVLIPDPGYPLYQSLISLNGGVPVAYPLDPANRFLPDIEAMADKITPATKAIMLNSPGNPTGSIHPMPTLKAIAEIVRQHDLWVVSDEIYAQIYFGDCFPDSLAVIPGMLERTIIMDGCSKAYGMTGWRVGFGHFPEPLVRPAETIMVHTHSCLPPFIMDAAEVAFKGPQDSVYALREAYSERAALVMAALDGVPNLSAVKPEGAFYIMVDTSQLFDGDDDAFANALLAEHGVAVLPGRGMGAQGQGFIRIALTQPKERLMEAVERMGLLAGA